MDKMFAAEFYYSVPGGRRYAETAKHLYDIAVLSALPEIKSVLADKEKCAYLTGLTRREEAVRHNSDLKDKPFSAFAVFDEFHKNNEFLRAYAAMQRVYVPDEKDIITINELRRAIDEIYGQVKAWDF